MAQDHSAARGGVVRIGIHHGSSVSTGVPDAGSDDVPAAADAGARSGLSGGARLSAAAHLSEQVSRVAAAAGAVVVGAGPCDVWLVDDASTDGPAAAPDVPVIRVRYGHGAREPVARFSPLSGTVLELPLDAEPLLRFLSSLRLAPRARVIGVAAARGGAGASTLAAALAREAVRGGTLTALADLDGASGGLDLLLGIEQELGPRWVDLRSERAGFPPDALSLALPRWHAVRVLSGDARGGARPDDPGVPDAVRSLVSEHDLVVLDLGDAAAWYPSREGAGPPEMPECQVLLVVAACDVRSAAAAAVLEREVRASETRLVVRTPGPGGLDPGELAEACGLPLAATTRTERGSAAAAERGEAPGDNRRGPIARTAARLAADFVHAP